MSFMPRLLVGVSFLALSAALCAQTGFVPKNPISPPTVAPPAMTSVPSLDLPVVTAPTLSPETPESPAGVTAGTAPKAARTTTTTTTTKGAAANKTATGMDGSKSASSTASTASALSMLGLGSNNSLLKALSGTDSDESSSDALSGLLGGSSSSTDSATLKKVLALLEKQQAGAAGNTGNSAAAGTSASTGAGAAGASAAAEKQSITSGGEIIRFTVNGNDIASSTTTLVSSILAKDGSFLLTGDRRYLVSRATRTETYYLLCRKNGDGSYRLHADVTQDSKNEYSFLYRLSRRGALKGAMTGDLLVFRTVDPDFRLDLVIRVIVPSVSKKSIR